MRPLPPTTLKNIKNSILLCLLASAPPPSATIQVAIIKTSATLLSFFETGG
ncbi:hypothetical protein Hdeb2414_s0572g00918511 [Helianthus debilis subsp. tardiflorus]